jgi:hypothetical protein
MRHLISALCLLAATATATAQEKSGRSCRVLFLGAAESDPEKLYLHDGTTTQEVELPRMNLSKTYKIAGGERTLRLLPAAPAEGEAPAAAAPAAKLAETAGDFYLLVSPDAANRVAPVRLQVIDASPERFKPGQMLWYNLTAHDVGGSVGTRRLAVKPRSRVVMDPPAAAAGDYNVNLSYRIAGKDALYPLCETKWSHVPSARTVLFIVTEPGSRTPRVLGFPDHPEPEGKNP